jgi:hypothetical protein
MNLYPELENVKPFKEDLVKSLFKNKTILHVGAASSPNSVEKYPKGTQFKKLQEVCKQVGIDNDKEAELSHRLLKNGVRIKYKFDFIFLGDVLEHIENPGLVLDELEKIKGNAKIVITVPNVYYFRFSLGFLFGEKVHPHHIFWPSFKTMESLFKRKDWKILYSNSNCMWGNYESAKIRKKALSFLTKKFKNLQGYLLFFIIDKTPTKNL